MVILWLWYGYPMVRIVNALRKIPEILLKQCKKNKKIACGLAYVKKK